MKRWMILLVTVAMMGSFCQIAGAAEDKKETTQEEKKTTSRPPVKRLFEVREVISGKGSRDGEGWIYDLA